MWETVNPYCITNGTHNIAKSFVDGEAKYTLWQLEPVKMCGIFDSADKAKEAVK